MSDIIAKTILTIGFITFALWVCWQFRIRREIAVNEDAWGDWPHLPEEATTRRTGGGGPSVSTGRRAEDRTRHSHHDGSATI
jgi:hypothetical protein